VPEQKDEDNDDGPKKRKRRLRISVHQGQFRASQNDEEAAPVKRPP
jgi:hypothetical protein